MRKRSLIIASILLVILAVIAIVLSIPKSPFLSVMAETMAPGFIPSSSYVANLKSSDTDLVRESLGFLKLRNDPAGVPSALPLLQSPDDYVWLNAALYTGAFGKQEAVPYLIKALRHTASRSDPDTVATLKTLTGKDYGGDFDKWQAWWSGQHPGQSFDWTSHLGFQSRIPNSQPN